jgi:uncharacterized membrane protein
VVCVENIENPNRCRFELRPNHSLSWLQAKWMIGSLICVALIIGGGFFLLGYTLVLPFSGLEVALVAGAMWVCLKRSECREIVSIGSDQITILREGARTQETQQLPRAWARVELSRPDYRWYPSRLLLRAHARSIEVGTFLTEEERQNLARELRIALLG